ncbi:MAG: ATP-NAD kinase family protein [Thermoplasmatales archaeon]
MKRVGFIVNPIAGMGGRVGLKGTDSPQMVVEAMKMGAIMTAPEKGYRALTRLKKVNEPLEVLTCPGKMGEETVRNAGFNYEIVCKVSEITTGSDSIYCSREILRKGADLLIFVGGDGTARNICESVGDKIVALGVPAGVKMYSSCFAVTPEAAGDLALMYLSNEKLETIRAEVLDVDEELFRKGSLSAKLYCYLKIPYESSHIQGSKTPTEGDSEKVQQEAIANQVIEDLQKGHYYIVGPGTTAKEVLKQLAIESNLLGVDIIFVKEDGGIELVGTDMNEELIKNSISGVGSGKLHLIITPLGGQGFLLGRGNQQISPRIIEKIGKEGIIVVATYHKIMTLSTKYLLVDTGSPETDKKLEGYYKAITGYHTFYLIKAKSWS